MQQIMKESGRQQLGGSNSPIQNQNQRTGGVLNEYFSKLPVRQQMDALKGGYGSVSKEFSQLAGKVSNPLITITKPVSIQEQLAGKLPLLSIEQKGGETSSSTSISSNSSSTSNSSSSSESNNNSNEGGTTRTIKFS
jgi:hypothetical protein